MALGHLVDNRDEGITVPYKVADEEKSIESNGRNSPEAFSISSRSDDLYSAFDPNFEEEMLEEDSPYPEVRSAVANFDDPDMPCATIRSWMLGLCWAILLPGLNQFFFFRYPTVSITGIVAQLMVFPVGRLWAHIMPNVKIFGHELNPGPFTIKEHVLVTIMAGVGAETAYATEIAAVQRVYYDQIFSFGYQWMLTMSTQLIGFSIGGVTRRFLVSPPSMIWPNTLVSCALFNTLHSQSYAGVGSYGGLSRERFFTYALAGAFFWYWIPGYLFQALGAFSWVCWIVPNNVVVNQLFGYRSGLGFSLLTFDWNQIAYIGSPLATPWWAEANVIGGFLFFFWFLTPLLYYHNVWNTAYLPLSSSTAYDNEGHAYNVSRILSPEKRFDEEAYNNYSPLYLSVTFALSYGLNFLGVSSTITHAIIHFWKPVKLHFKRSLREQPDIHTQLMSRYSQVPEWYYLVIFAITFAMACVCCMCWPTEMTIWALVIALIVALIYVIPIGMIQAITNRQIGLNVITELIVGFMLPGRPVAMMMFKTYGYVTMSQAMQFTADFKLGHYMKVPPRPMFWCQVVATMIAGTAQLGVQAWMFTNIDNMCDRNQKDHFTCESIHVFGTASIIWGVIGPSRQFTHGMVYYGLMFCFIVGAACPLIHWVIMRRFPRSILYYLNFPLIFAGLGLIPPASAVNYVPWAITGFVFQFLVRRRHFSFWAKYNYVLSAALDGGTALGVIIIYFCLQFPKGGTVGADTIQSWWGNTVFTNTADWKRTPWLTLAPGEKFS